MLACANKEEGILLIDISDLKNISLLSKNDFDLEESYISSIAIQSNA